MRQGYRVGEVAERTGVSVRTLHHYDRVGLLRPARTPAGYRVYGEPDLLRLHQILTLRYLGFPLRRIGDLLDRPDFNLAVSLCVQEHALRLRMAELARMADAIAALVARHRQGGVWDWDLMMQASAAAATGLARQEQIVSELYTPEQMQQFAELAQRYPPEEIAAVEQGWAALLAEVRAHPGLDAASPEAQALLARWEALHERTQRAYAEMPGLSEAIAANYDRGAYEGNLRAPQAADFAFIERARAARG